MELKCPRCTACPHDYCVAERRSGTTLGRGLTPEESRWVENGIAKLERVARQKQINKTNAAKARRLQRLIGAEAEQAVAENPPEQ